MRLSLYALGNLLLIKKEDAKSHDILLCIQTGKTINDENRMRYPSETFYLKSPEEMYDMFSYVPEALENTMEVHKDEEE